MRRFILLILTSALLLITTSFAQDKSESTQFGRDIHVAAGERIAEATCFGCSVYVRGQVSGDVTTFGGRVVLEEGASVGGDITTFGGELRAQAGSLAEGDVTVLGGHLRRDPQARIGGDVTAFEGFGWFIAIMALPLLFLAGLIALIVWLIRRGQQPRTPVYAPVPNTRV